MEGRLDLLNLKFKSELSILLGDAVFCQEEIYVVTPASALIGYAILRANYDSDAPTYLDNFQAFVLSVLAETDAPYLDKPAIAASIRQDFGINIPDLVVGRLIRRTNKHSLTRFVGSEAVSLTEIGRSKAPGTLEEITTYRRKQVELTEHFRSFVRENYPEHTGLIREDLGDALAEYFDRHAVPLLNEGLRGRGRSENPASGMDFLVSSFVAKLADSDQTRFSYVVEAAKGAMLASLLVLDTSGLKESLGKLTLVLDTPILMDVLGFHGEIPGSSMNQVLALAREQGAKLVAFEHCISEVHGILESIEHALRRPSGSRSTAPGYLHFAETNHTPADLMLLRGEIGERLGKISVSVVDTPGDYLRYGLDEGLLEEAIEKKVHYQQDAARLNDVRSLAAVHRMRKGERDSALERCGAVLVTSNSSLAFAAVDFDRSERSFPLAVTSEGLATILWVRTPAATSDVPKQILLAAAFAGMQPGMNLWSRYLDEVAKLESRAAISPEEAIILRSSRGSRDWLMEETLGDTGLLTETSPLEVLEHMRSEITSPLQEQVDALQSQVEEVSSAAEQASADWIRQDKARIAAETQTSTLESEKSLLTQRLDLFDKEEKDRRERLGSRAKTHAFRVRRKIVLGARLITIISVIVAAVFFFLDPEGRVGISIAGGAGIIGVLVLFLPKPTEWIDKWEHQVAVKRESKLLADAGFEAEDI